MEEWKSIEQLVSDAETNGCTLSEAVLRQQAELLELDRDLLIDRMRQRLQVIRVGLAAGLGNWRRIH